MKLQPEEEAWLENYLDELVGKGGNSAIAVTRAANLCYSPAAGERRAEWLRLPLLSKFHSGE